MGTTRSSPRRFLALAMPAFGLWNVRVRSGLTASPWASPVSDSIPVGMSTATLNALDALMAAAISRYGDASAPLTPVPIRASTTTSASRGFT